MKQKGIQKTIQVSLCNFALAIISVIGSFDTAFSQVTLTKATKPDATFMLGTGTVKTSCANISYAGCPCGSGQLMAVTWANPIGGSSAPGFAISDGVNPTQQILLPLNVINTDIVLADNTSTPNSFYVGLVYESPISSSNSDIIMNTYVVTLPLLSPPVLVSSNIINNMAGMHTAHYPRIDMIAESGSTGFTGMPLCDRYVITYVDDIVPVSGGGFGNNLYGHYGSFSGAVPPLTQLITGATPYVFPENDVAGIQRLDPSSGTIHDMALITVLRTASWAGPQIFYLEWDIATGMVTPLTYVGSGNGTFPHIDAIDDYTVNSSPSVIPWQISYNDVGTVTPGVVYNNTRGTNYIYSSTCGGSAAYEISDAVANNFLFPGTTSFTNNSPGVAYFAPTNSYSMSWYDVLTTNNQVIIGNVDNVTTGMMTGMACTYSPTYPNYYSVNASPIISPSASGAEYGQCISSSFNTRDNLLICWLSGADIMYKCTNNNYAYRSGAHPAANTSDKISLYPNPASDYITIDCPKDALGAAYIINDVSGRELLRGNITSAGQQVQISMLATGMYTVKIDKDGMPTRNIQFIKQ